MNRSPTPLLLLACLAATVLSGCTGYPDDVARVGSEVALTYTAYDADTGEELASDAVGFVVGSGDSGLGHGFELGLVGHREDPNATFTVVSRDDPTRDYLELVEVARDLGPVPLVQEAPLDVFIQFIGEPEVGMTFPLQGIDGRVESFTNETVSYRLLIEDGSTEPVPVVGALLVNEVRGEVFHRVLAPDVGATFVVTPPANPGQGTPLGLAVGAYRTEGATDDMLQYRYSAVRNPELLGRDVRFEVTLLGVVPPEPVADDGSQPVTQRTSPVLQGTPDLARQLSGLDEGDHDDHAAADNDDHADDGHAH